MAGARSGGGRRGGGTEGDHSFLSSFDGQGLWGGPFPSYRAHNGPRGERAHLRPTTQNPKYS